MNGTFLNLALLLTVGHDVKFSPYEGVEFRNDFSGLPTASSVFCSEILKRLALG